MINLVSTDIVRIYENFIFFQYIFHTIFGPVLLLNSSQLPSHICHDIMTIVLVTGANRGIGFAIVRSAASRIPSATFIVGCRSVEAGHQAVEQLRHFDLKATFDHVQIDIERDDSILNAVNIIQARYGKLDGETLSSVVHVASS